MDKDITRTTKQKQLLIGRKRLQDVKKMHGNPSAKRAKLLFLLLNMQICDVFRELTSMVETLPYIR